MIRFNEQGVYWDGNILVIATENKEPIINMLSEEKVQIALIYQSKTKYDIFYRHEPFFSESYMPNIRIKGAQTTLEFIAWRIKNYFQQIDKLNYLLEMNYQKV